MITTGSQLGKGGVRVWILDDKKKGHRVTEIGKRLLGASNARLTRRLSTAVFVAAISRPHRELFFDAFSVSLCLCVSVSLCLCVSVSLCLCASVANPSFLGVRPQ